MFSRFARAGALLLVAVIGLLTLHQATPAAAQDASHGVHLFYTTQLYAQRHNNRPNDSTNNLHYYGGPIMPSSKSYAIYWAPSGHAIPATYQTLINRYFGDVGGSGMYKVMTQYPDTSHALKNKSSFGGAWTDTTTYPHSGTGSDPLTDADIQGSVSRALAANGWSPGLTNMYFVFTAPGIESCIDATDCTPGTFFPAFCAYHGFFLTGGVPTVYANMPYDETWTTDCRSFSTSPNGDLASDSEISIVSHEHYEAVTDPKVPSAVAWYDNVCSGASGEFCGEIGDKCAYRYGTTGSDGRNLTLNGHPYIVQLEFSNKNNTGASYSGCVTSGTSVSIQDVWTASDTSGTLEPTFHRGDKAFYFAGLVNTGGSCTTTGSWVAKKGSSTIANWSGNITVPSGVSSWYLKRKIPRNAPLGNYNLTVTTKCGTQTASLSTKFKVVAGPITLDDSGPETTAPVQQ